jgi:hypothetical protein
MANKDDLIKAIDLALGGNWESAHTIVQQLDDEPVGCLIHAVLHKIEGDVGNSKYWYARSGGNYDDHTDANSELAIIRTSLTE